MYRYSTGTTVCVECREKLLRKLVGYFSCLKCPLEASGGGGDSDGGDEWVKAADSSPTGARHTLAHSNPQPQTAQSSSTFPFSL